MRFVAREGGGIIICYATVRVYTIAFKLMTLVHLIWNGVLLNAVVGIDCNSQKQILVRYMVRPSLKILLKTSYRLR